MRTKRRYAWLAASLAILAGEPLATSQVTSNWPVANATPQQTRFADVTFGGPPAGILWRETNIVASGIVSDGLLVLRSSANGVWSTRICDAETGGCLYTFPENNMALGAFGKLGARTTLFHGLRVLNSSQQTTLVTLTAYDLTPILARTPGAQPAALWSAEYTLSSTVPPFLNYMEGALYLGNFGGVLKIDGASGNLIWADFEPASNVAVGDVWVPSAGGPQRERLVIGAGHGNNTVRALYDRDGSVAWQTTAERAQYVTLVKVPAPTGPLDEWRVVVPFGLEMASLLCLNASDGSVMPNWPQPLKPNCYAANGPVAVRYLYDASGAVTNTAIYITPGSDEPADTSHPLFAFDVYGGNAWPGSLPNPVQLPSAAAWTEPAVTRDRVFLILQDGSLFSMDLKSGKTAVDQFQIDRGSVLPIVADNGHGPLLYALSTSLGYMALAPNERFQPRVPSLTISLTETNGVLLSWPSSFEGFVLQQNSNLSTTIWMTLTNAPLTVGSSNQVTIPPPTGNQFYRLRQQ